MKNPIIFIVVSMLLLCLSSCDNWRQKTKVDSTDQVIANPEETGTSDPKTPGNCVNACFIKDAYYQLQLSRIQHEYEMDSSLQSTLYDTLIAITEDLMLKCNCRTIGACPRCPRPQPECCDGISDCPFKDCTSESIRRPDCIRSKNKIDYFTISKLDGSTIAKAKISSENLINDFYEYKLEYLQNDDYDVSVYEFKEEGFEIIYSVKFKRSE